MDYQLHKMDDKDFEDLVVHICRDWLGQGVTSFSEGPDGGRDATFEGTADNFPSKRSPASGKFVIQAKSTGNPVASCSDGPFSTIVKGELHQIKKLKEDNKLDNYMLFTNRKKSAAAEDKIPTLIKDGAGVAHVWLLGLEDIEIYLDTNPTLVQQLHLDRLRNPLRIHPEDLASLIIAFHDNIGIIDEALKSAFNYPEYPGIKRKNRINNLSTEYFEYIKARSEPYFNDIRGFLENPRNSKLLQYYHNISDQFQSKIIAHRSKFATFDEVFDHLYDAVKDLYPNIPGQLVNVFMHYMYCHCDVGDNV